MGFFEFCLSLKAQSEASPSLVLIDALDHKILQELARQPLASVRTIGGTLDEPSSSIQFRIGKLRENGVILGIAYWLRAESLGIQRFRFILRSKAETSNERKELIRFAENHPNICNITLYIFHLIHR